MSGRPGSASAGQAWWLFGVGIAPSLVWVFLLANPGVDAQIVLPSEHFLVVSLVSLLGAAIALLVVRTALVMEQYQVLLVALGFMTMAGFFAVHALATPGSHVAPMSNATGNVSADPYGSVASTMPGPVTFDYTGTVIGASAFLSLSAPALYFAAASSSRALARLRSRVPSQVLTAASIAVPLLYAGLAAWRGDLVGRLPIAQPPLVYALMLASGALLIFAAWKQADAYALTHFPVNGALVVAFLLLAQAVVLVVLSAFWTVAWWSYHVLMLAGVVVAISALLVELDRRRGLERFLSRQLVERVVSGDLMRLDGERRTVTILFADLRGSTTLAERLQPEQVIAILNTYVGALAGCVFAHDGMLDKFLGDGLMAIFGIVPDPSDGAVPGALTALDMRQTIQRLNSERLAAGEAVLEFGVALHTGEVVLGAVGLPQRSDFTAIGDTVNTAARLEGQCREVRRDILLSAATASRLSPDTFALADMGVVSIRGKEQGIAIATLADKTQAS